MQTIYILKFKFSLCSELSRPTFAGMPSDAKRHGNKAPNKELSGVKKKKKKNKNPQNASKPSGENPKQAPKSKIQPPPSAGPSQGKKKGGSLLDQMRQKLQGGQFRWLNEQLYTTGGDNALSIMKKNPELYEKYHEGEISGHFELPFAYHTILIQIK